MSSFSGIEKLSRQIFLTPVDEMKLVPRFGYARRASNSPSPRISYNGFETVTFERFIPPRWQAVRAAGRME